jgi:hypothetical protein
VKTTAISILGVCRSRDGEMAITMRSSVCASGVVLRQGQCESKGLRPFLSFSLVGGHRRTFPILAHRHRRRSVSERVPLKVERML